MVHGRVLLVKVAHGGHLCLAHFFHTLQLIEKLGLVAAAPYALSQLRQLELTHACKLRAADTSALDVGPARRQLLRDSCSLHSRYCRCAFVEGRGNQPRH